MFAKGQLGETSGQVKPEQENIIRIKGIVWGLKKTNQSAILLLEVV